MRLVQHVLLRNGVHVFPTKTEFLFAIIDLTIVLFANYTLFVLITFNIIIIDNMIIILIFILLFLLLLTYCFINYNTIKREDDVTTDKYSPLIYNFFSDYNIKLMAVIFFIKCVIILVNI